MPITTKMYSLIALYFVLPIGALLYHLYHRCQRSPQERVAAARTTSQTAPNFEANPKGNEERQLCKDLYHQLQNLENFPQILPEAQEFLVTLLHQSLLIGRYKSYSEPSILDIESYTPLALERFVSTRLEETLESWQYYLRRREAGYGAELFVNRKGAEAWLKRCAPLNLIDGAWLCHLHKVTTPFALRGVTKDTWQTLSEELGDGNLDKNHVHIFKDLLREAGVVLPDTNHTDFINTQDGMHDASVWKAATAQLLISLFPNDFLPEILGFNLHFEQLSVQTLKASKELPEYGISGYYYTLHVSIDNADSGHSAMALATVVKFMDLVSRSDLMDYQEAWRRIQSGYLLSQCLDAGDSLQSCETKVADILHDKAALAGKIHCSSRVRIGQQNLADWLSTESCNRAWKREFLEALADAKPWVYRGYSDKSLLMRELSWKGKMFGAFTHGEVEIMRTWIDLLEPKDTGTQTRYWSLVGRSKHDMASTRLSNQDIATSHPKFPPQQAVDLYRNHWCQPNFSPRPPLRIYHIRFNAFLPLWFVHPCLLENTVTSLCHTSTRLGSLILQLLRAELGYTLDNSGIAGMDEQMRLGRSSDIITLGLEVMQRHSLPQPTCLKDVLGEQDEEFCQPRTFAYGMLSWAMRPIENQAFLLGLARGFLDLEEVVAYDDGLLSTTGREALRNLVSRKKSCFESCMHELSANTQKRCDFVGGYELARTVIENALE